MSYMRSGLFLGGAHYAECVWLQNERKSCIIKALPEELIDTITPFAITERQLNFSSRIDNSSNPIDRREVVRPQAAFALSLRK